MWRSIEASGLGPRASVRRRPAQALLLTKNERSCYSALAMKDDVLLDHSLNPKFVHYCTVSDDELDPFRRLPKAALMAHIDSAVQAWRHRCGDGAFLADMSVEYLEPVIGAQTIRIDLWVERMDDTSCTYGFVCSSENGNLASARGERSLVKRDQKPWSPQFRDTNATLMKDLHAYA